MTAGHSIRALLAALLLAGGAAPRAFSATDVDAVPRFDAAARENDFAVVIGVEKYRDVSPSAYSAGDAKLVSEYLLALGLPARNIELLRDERATRSDIQKAIERWLPNNVKPDSRVFVYYSGHGSPDPTTGEAYIVPHDGDPMYLADYGYPLKRLYEQLAKLPVKEVAVVIDSCFSGTGGHSVLPKGVRPLVATVSLEPVSTAKLAVLAATKGSQTSTSSDEKQHGIFTYHFLKAVREGKTALADIYEYVRPRVQDEAKATSNVTQIPNLTPEPAQAKGRFIFFDHKPLPPLEQQDPGVNSRLEAERKKFEEEQARLAEERRQMIEKMEREKRQMEQERRRMEQEIRAKEESMERERQDLRRKKEKGDAIFVPPTF